MKLIREESVPLAYVRDHSKLDFKGNQLNKKSGEILLKEASGSFTYARESKDNRDIDIGGGSGIGKRRTFSKDRFYKGGNV